MDHFYWHALKAIPHVGNVTFRRLIERFSSPENVFRASEEELASVRGLHPDAASSIRNRDCQAEAEKECRAVAGAGVDIISFLSPQYPKALLQIHDHPPYLYVKGTLRDEERAIAIVGSRRASAYGMTTAERFARELAAHGIAVVSGMARGIDAASHIGALKVDGRSIGVLGCGIDVIYPKENARLFSGITGKGALLSEFPMGTEPRPENFPRRNRIISGISMGVLVVEASENSGSLITAQHALEQGREVFAVPGNINYGTCRGSNRLIKQGAKLVERVEDILEEFHQDGPVGRPPVPIPKITLSPREAAIYTLLAADQLHIDDIILKSALTVGEVSAILLRLELNGLISQLPGKYFVVS
ncbi:MAG TPA: DNA-processing protein DprA [Geobacteraceae bacterium]|nr:DNA-processing protein DprA [Geobacteraceae bacterium]